MKSLLIVATLFGLAGGGEKETHVALGKKAPEFSLTPLEKDGKASSFADLSKDKITVVDFWSCKCPVSRGWEDRLKTIYDDYSKKGVAFVVVNSNSTENASEIEEYKKTAKIPYGIWLDPRSEVADIFAAKTTPHIFVFDKKGELQYVGAIDDNADGKKKIEDRKNYLRDALDSLLSNKKVAVQSTTPTGCGIKRPKP